MKRNKLTEQDKKTIWDLYKSGKSYREITKDVGFSSSTLTKIVGGYRTLSQCALLARKNGNYKLSNAGRLKLSENGRKACIRSGKFWTKPERFFRDIILEIGIGVKYPDYIKEMNYPTTKDGWVSRIKALPMSGFIFRPSLTVRL